MKYLLVLLALCVGCSVVGPGQRGIRVSLGSVSEDPKPPGPYLWIPFIMGMAKVDVQIQKSQIEGLTAASKDMQEVNAVVAINWSLNAETVVKTYKEIGNEYDVERRILIPALSEVLKAATAKRNAEEILTKRLELKKDIDDGLQSKMTQYGIHLLDVSIINIAFSKEFTVAIEAKQIAEQQAKQASYVADKATQEARAEVERAKGQNEAQKLLQSTTTAAILQKAAIDKWDGKFPQVMGSGNLPFILNMNK